MKTQIIFGLSLLLFFCLALNGCVVDESTSYYDDSRVFCDSFGMEFDFNNKDYYCILVEDRTVIKRCELIFIDGVPKYLDLTSCEVFG